MKLSHNAKVCNSTFNENILKYELHFTQLQDQMNIHDKVRRKAVYKATLSPSLQTTWRQACMEPPVNANFSAMNLLQFTDARDQFVLKASDCICSLAADTRHWPLYDLHKRQNMSFQKQINKISEYFPRMPRPKDTMLVTP